MLTTTLSRIREQSPCKSGWEKLLAHLGKTSADDEPLGYDVILKSNGLEDALWCMRAEPQEHKRWTRFAIMCARRVQHLMPAASVAALEVIERWTKGEATGREVEDAATAARDAADAAWTSWAAPRTAAQAAATAARAAAWAAMAARDAATAAWTAATAAWDAATAARDAADAAWDATRAARAAERDAQTQLFLQVVGESLPPWRSKNDETV